MNRPSRRLRRHNRHRLRSARSARRGGRATRSRRQACRGPRRCEKMLALERQLYGPDHDDIAGSLAWLARLHAQLGENATANKLAEEQLAMRKKLHGEKHWSVTEAQLDLTASEHLAAMRPEQRTRDRSCHAAEQGECLAGTEKRNPGRGRRVSPSSSNPERTLGRETFALRGGDLGLGDDVSGIGRLPCCRAFGSPGGGDP